MIELPVGKPTSVSVSAAAYLIDQGEVAAPGRSESGRDGPSRPAPARRQTRVSRRRSDPRLNTKLHSWGPNLLAPPPPARELTSERRARSEGKAQVVRAAHKTPAARPNRQRRACRCRRLLPWGSGSQCVAGDHLQADRASTSPLLRRTRCDSEVLGSDAIVVTARGQRLGRGCGPLVLSSPGCWSRARRRPPDGCVASLHEPDGRIAAARAESLRTYDFCGVGHTPCSMPA
jgi:hypothetical protein